MLRERKLRGVFALTVCTIASAVQVQAYEFLASHCFEGTTAYCFVKGTGDVVDPNWKSYISKIENIDGTPSTTLLVSDAQWRAFSDESGVYDMILPGNRVEVIGEYVQFADQTNDGIYRVHKTTGALSTLVSNAAIRAHTGLGSARLIDATAFSRCGEMAFYDQDSDRILLAVGGEADPLAVLTDDECVWLRYGRPDAERLTRVTAADARRWLEAGEFPEGSMGPKVQAAINFLRDSTRNDPTAIITHATKLAEALAGKTGTTFVRG